MLDCFIPFTLEHFSTLLRKAAVAIVIIINLMNSDCEWEVEVQLGVLLV